MGKVLRRAPCPYRQGVRTQLPMGKVLGSSRQAARCSGSEASGKVLRLRDLDGAAQVAALEAALKLEAVHLLGEGRCSGGRDAPYEEAAAQLAAASHGLLRGGATLPGSGGCGGYTCEEGGVNRGRCEQRARRGDGDGTGGRAAFPHIRVQLCTLFSAVGDVNGEAARST